MAVTAGCCSPSDAGEPFTCDRLGGCSITDLGDVDTTTTAPSPGDILVWDGTQWVSGPGGTEVTGGETPTAIDTVTGTGQPGDPYVVTTDVKVSGEPDNAIAINPDGLYVPKHYFDALRLEVTTVSGTVDLDQVVTPGSGLTNLGSVSGQFANPSPTLPMRAVLQISVNHGQFGFHTPSTTVHAQSRVEVSGAVETALEAHQRIHDTRTGTQELDFMGSTKAYPITIPPGGVITLTLIGQLNVPLYTGRADVNELNHIVTIWGGTYG